MADIFSHLPHAPKHRLISLSIDGNDVRIITVEDLRIARFLTRPLDPALLPGGTVVNPAAFGAAVRTILSEYEIANGPVVAGFPDAGVQTRLLTLPKRRGLNVGDEVKRAAAADPALSADGYRLFHQVVAEQADQVTVFLLAVRRAALANFMAGLHEAGIAPQKVELRPLALVRGVGQAQIVIAHAERTFLDVVIVKDDMPVVMRSLPLAGDDTVAEIVHEVVQALAAYNSASPAPLDMQLPVALTGELADNTELRESIHSRLGRTVASVTSPFQGAPGFNASTFVINVGLVLGAL